ncbi:MAG: hypothetical protein QM500_16175 [Methylococcales bacterium]
MKKGFNRLKGVAAASAMGVGLLGAGSGRAATFPLSGNVNIDLVATASNRDLTAEFNGINTNMSISDWTIFADTLTTTSSSSYVFSDAFDGALGMSVDGVSFSNPDSNIDLTNNILTSDVHTDIVAGINAQVQHAFIGSRGGSSMGLIRALYSFTNTSAAAISITVNVDGNLGSDGGTIIQATDSGDLIADDNDKWTISSDQAVGVDADAFSSTDPILLITRYGTGASVIPVQSDVIADGDGFWGNDYDLTIPAGETQRIMAFVEAHSTNTGAASSAASLEVMTPSLLADLTDIETSEIVNYSGVLAPAPSSSSSGSTDVPSLLALLGIPVLLRRFKKKKAKA